MVNKYNCILQISLQMFEDDLIGLQQEQFDFQLDKCRINKERKQTSNNDSTISRHKISISEKQRTRQQSYEDIMKSINRTKIEKIELSKQLEQVKKGIYISYLQNLQQILKEMNDQNLKLRKDINLSVKKGDDKEQRQTNLSPIIREHFVKSNYDNQNNKTNIKGQKYRISPSMKLLKKDAKLTQSANNLGGSQIRSPKCHKKRQSQLTDKKAEQNNLIEISVNISTLDQKVDEFNIKQSISKQYLKFQFEQNQNIFIQILEEILLQQKEYQQQQYEQLQNHRLVKYQQYPNYQISFINSIERQIKNKSQRLEILTLAMNKYQKQIKELNINLRDAQNLVQKIWSVKSKYIEMQKKCLQLAPIRKQVRQKQQKLSQIRNNLIVSSQEQKPISSIETLIKLLSEPTKIFTRTTNLYLSYCKQIKELFKYGKQQQVKRNTKFIKVKETIDIIRQAKKKFNELIHIYQFRILKLEGKISKIKITNQTK